MRAIPSRLGVAFGVIALLGGTAITARVASERPLEGLVSWWTGDGTAEDVMDVNDGSLLGGASFAPGVVGQAFNFRGPGDYVEVPHSQSLDITGAITMAGWFKSNTANGGMLMFKGDAGGTPATSSYGLHIGNWDRTDGSVVVVLYGGFPADRFESVAGLVPSDHCWYHVAATWDGTITNPENVKLYVNGVLAQSWTKRNPLNSTFESLTIGSMKPSPYYHATDGLIDEAALYARALSAAEIHALYDAGSAGRCSAAYAWNASYDMMWDGPRTDGDEFLDVPYPFKYGWSFNLQNTPSGSLPAPTITATWPHPINGINPTPVPVEQTPLSATWSRAELMPGISMPGSLSSTQVIPTPYSLGYEVARQMPEGRQIQGGANLEPRTFLVTLTTHDPTIAFIGASIGLGAEAINTGPGPVSTQDVSCIPSGGRILRTTPAVFWKVGEAPDPPPVADSTYTLRCTFNVTNNSPFPVLFSPSVIVSARRIAAPVTGVGSVSYTSPGLLADPPDPLGTVTFETGASTARASLTSGLTRSVIFNGVNAYDDHTAPTTTATLSPTSNDQGWNTNPPVTVTLHATDEGGSGVKQIWYRLQYPGSPSPTQPTFVLGDTATISNLSATGTTIVTYYAVDTAGNMESRKSLPVRIDAIPPAIGTVAASPGVLWPPNHKMVSIALGVTVVDNVTPAPACRVVSVTSNEPLNGTGDGNTPTDYIFSGVGLDLSLRAERAGNLADRIYTVGVVCKDTAGNESEPKTVVIVVPHDQGKK